jgi:cell fate (sporulation/competence/biofilm development) regulator YlbF (YheA/YmcA/DUF963 family)
MTTIELAKQLAASLAAGDEYHKYQAAQKMLAEHEAAKLMLDDFRKKQWEYERKKMSGEKSLEPYESELRKQSEVIGLNPYIREYLMAEYQFSQLMMEVQRIIGEAVGLEKPAGLNEGGDSN